MCYAEDVCRGLRRDSMRADSNASWMTQRIVVYVSGILHICDAAQLDQDDLQVVSSVRFLSSPLFDGTIIPTPELLTHFV